MFNYRKVIVSMANQFYSGLISLFLLIGSAHAALEGNARFISVDKRFPADKHILAQACLFFEVYYRLDDSEIILFDGDEPSVILGRVSLAGLGREKARDSARALADETAARIRYLASHSKKQWDAEHHALRKCYPASRTGAELMESAGRLRWKKGMKRSFRTSMERSYQYLDWADSILKLRGVPTRFKYLPHVESSFLPSAVSHKSAAGLWQFLPASAAPYLEINGKLDQRFDPEASTRAAADFLSEYHRHLKSWALVVMAYNNGISQITQAIQQTKSRDPSRIILNYKSPSFKAVSKEYYAMFLAASSLAMQADRFFPDLKKRRAAPTRQLTLSHPWTPVQIRLLSGYSRSEIRRLNPAVKAEVFVNNLALPAGFVLKLPVHPPTDAGLVSADLPNKGPDRWELVAAGAPGGYYATTFLSQSLFLQPRVGMSPSGANNPVRNYCRTHGLLDAAVIALARDDGILISPHLEVSRILPVPDAVRGNMPTYLDLAFWQARFQKSVEMALDFVFARGPFGPSNPLSMATKSPSDSR